MESTESAGDVGFGLGIFGVLENLEGVAVFD
jgi:hypothetical protein